jgi:hypothetical protein
MNKSFTRKTTISGRHRLLYAALWLIVACSSSTDPIALPIPLSALNGAWRPTTPEVPGLTYEFTLVLADAHITGGGQWALLGGQSGTVTVTGLASGDAISLDLTLGHDSPETLPFLIEHFEGRLRSTSELVGTLTFAGEGTAHTYSKVGP